MSLNKTHHVCVCTDNLEAAVRMKLPNVSSAEPSLAVRIHEEILTVLLLVLIVSHGDVGPADQNLSSWVWFVCAVIAACNKKERGMTSTYLIT